MANASEPRRWLIVSICFAAIIFDGYDLIVFGSTMPSLLAYEPWGLSAAEAGVIGSYALLGMFFGALLAGPLTERFGRRTVFVGCLVLYSTAMAFVALAPTPAALSVFRFVAGLGFGGIAPVAIALVVEVARPHERNRLNAAMLCGLPVGGIVAAVASILFLDDLGFRAMWGLGCIALVTVVPLAWRYLPETAGIARGPGGERGSARLALRSLLSSRSARVALILFSLANFLGFLLVFGLNTWLPQLMRTAGYSLNSALAFQLLLNGGAVIGGLAGAALADRRGARLVAAASFLVAAVTIVLISVGPPPLLLGAITLAAGAGSIGTQIIVFGFSGTYFDQSVRATALGLTTGVGRLGAVLGPTIGGVILSAGFSTTAAFGVFAVAALIGAFVCLAVPAATERRPAATLSPSKL